MHLWSNTKDDASCKSWCEVDAIKYLFHVSQPWTRAMPRTPFILDAWSKVGIGFIVKLGASPYQRVIGACGLWSGGSF